MAFAGRLTTINLQLPAWSFVGTKTARNRHLGHGRGLLYCFCKTHFFALSLYARGARSIPMYWLEGFGTITRNETHKSALVRWFYLHIVYYQIPIPIPRDGFDGPIDEGVCARAETVKEVGQLKSTHSAV